MSKNSLEKQALNSSALLTPYFFVVNAAEWLLVLSNGVASSCVIARPTWKDWNAWENSSTVINL